MKTNKFTTYSIILTTMLLGLLAFLLLNGTFQKGSTTNPAEPYETALFLLFLVVLVLWSISGVVGWIMLSRRGFFAAQLERLAGAEWMFCLAGILLLAGLWIIAVLPGPYLMWFASTRRPRPMCPNCKNWMPYTATRCANCGTPLQAEPAPAAAPPKVDERALESDLVPRCEECQDVNPPGAVYTFAYGTLAGSEYLGDQRTRYDFNIAGRENVFLCDRCVTKFGKQRVRKLCIKISFVLLAIMVGLVICSLLMNVYNPEGAPQTDFLLPGVLSALLLIPVFYISARMGGRKRPLEQGDRLAIELRKPALESQGYTRFFTRQQIKDNQLL